MKAKFWRYQAALYVPIVVLLALLAACSAAATPTPAPPAATTAPQPETTPAGQSTAPAQAEATPAPTTAPQPISAPADQPVSARDKAIAVVGSEPERLFFMTTADAHTTQINEQMDYYIGHLDKKTLQVTPSHVIASWKQTAPDEWVYELRPGVTFHDGEPWNAEVSMAE